MNHKSQSGFSLVEVLIAIAVLGVIAAIAIISVDGMVTSSRETKLSSDVSSINRAILAFKATGGDLSGANSADEVLSALKATVANAEQLPGFSGSKIDERLLPRYQTSDEAEKGNLCAYWDADSQTFQIGSPGSGQVGISKFVLDADEGEKDHGTVEVTKPMKYAAEDSWIWDYEEVAPTSAAGPSSFTTTPVPSGSTPPTPGPGTSTPPPSSSVTTLTPPVFSIPAGGYPISQYSLTLSLTDPNPAGASDIYYSVDFGNWAPYTGPISVSPDATIAAQAVAATSEYSSSSRVDQQYIALPEDLLPPTIIPSVTTLGLFSDTESLVTIVNPNSPGISSLEYRIAGGPWLPYDVPFSIARTDYPEGSLIQARSVPTDQNYIASTTTLRTIGVEAISLTGDGKGTFSNPIGGKHMTTNLSSGESNSYFEWGSITSGDSGNTGNGLSKSWMSFDANPIGAILPGTVFELGTLSYYNGEIYTGTGADSVTLSIDLGFDLNGVGSGSSADFSFNLINTPNNANDVWKDADYVQLSNSSTTQNINFNGIEFKLELQFGSATENGLSSFDEFHVIEKQTASTKVFGSLVQVGPLNFNL